MVAGVHDGAADGGADAHMTGPAGLTDHDVLVIQIAHGADGGAGLQGDHSNFAAGKT